MILNLEQFTRAAQEVERIISLEEEPNLRAELIHSAEGIDNPRTRREFFQHMNTLFLNVLLNRLNEVGLNREERVLEARRIIVEFINS